MPNRDLATFDLSRRLEMAFWTALEEGATVEEMDMTYRATWATFEMEYRRRVAEVAVARRLGGVGR